MNVTKSLFAFLILFVQCSLYVVHINKYLYRRTTDSGGSWGSVVYDELKKSSTVAWDAPTGSTLSKSDGKFRCNVKGIYKFEFGAVKV